MGAAKAGVLPKDLVVVSGIGCSSNLPGYVHSYGVHSLHGRAIAVATGIRLANTDLKVVITGGDGDGYGIGIGHFIHAMRRNLDLTYIVMDNQIYGLTTGQASPTTMKDQRTKSTPHGNVESPINPLALAIVSGATYVARGYSGEPNQLADLIAGGISAQRLLADRHLQPLRHLQQGEHLRLLQEALLQARRRQGLRSRATPRPPWNAPTSGATKFRWAWSTRPAAHLRRQRAGLQEWPRGEAAAAPRKVRLQQPDRRKYVVDYVVAVARFVACRRSVNFRSEVWGSNGAALRPRLILRYPIQSGRA